MDLNGSPAASFEPCQFLVNMDVMSKFDKAKSDHQRHKNTDWLFQDTWGPSLRLSLPHIIIIAKYLVWFGARRAAPENVLPMPPRRTFSRSLSYFHKMLNSGRRNIAHLETRQHTRETSGILWPNLLHHTVHHFHTNTSHGDTNVVGQSIWNKQTCWKRPWITSNKNKGCVS